ncbi:MAG: beta-ketoacyl synthase chain length factor [Betaproteobacteria bacterium]
MTVLAIAGVGVCATGMEKWKDARSLLRADAISSLAPLPRQAPACLPAIERRRANTTTRFAVSAAMQAIEGVAVDDVVHLASVFSSSDGDGEVLASMLAALAQPQVTLSPTLFHNSVFNAPSGYWSIGSGAVAPSITLSAGRASFAAGLAEARAQIIATGEPVLLITYDAPFPDTLAAFARSAEPFACAFRLEPATAPTSPSLGVIEIHLSAPDVPLPAMALPKGLPGCFAGNAAADSLPLLVAIARGRPGRTVLPWLNGSPMWLDFQP